MEAFFLDILVAIDVIKRCTKDMAVPEDILKDEFKYNTVLRSFHLIGEAMSHVLDEKSLDSSHSLSSVTGVCACPPSPAVTDFTAAS